MRLRWGHSFRSGNQAIRWLSLKLFAAPVPPYKANRPREGVGEGKGYAGLVEQPAEEAEIRLSERFPVKLDARPIDMVDALTAIVRLVELARLPNEALLPREGVLVPVSVLCGLWQTDRRDALPKALRNQSLAGGHIVLY